MKMMKKAAAAAMAAIFAAASLTGCSGTSSSTGSANSTSSSNSGSASTNSSSASSESTGGSTYTGAAPVTEEAGATVSMLAMNSWYSTVDLSKNAQILDEIQKRANVTINWNMIDPTIYADTVSPMLAAGSDLQDIVELPDKDPTMSYIKSGMFVALDEYFDSMPNYKKFLDENPNIKAMLTATDGHIYYVPQTVVTNNYQPCMMINVRWLDKLGLSEPKTLDEFVSMLRAFRDNDMNGNGDATDEIPMSLTSQFVPYLFGPAFGLDLVSGFYADDAGTVHYAYYDSENYKKYLEFVKSLYDEGLLEMEYTSLNRDQITSRCAQDITGVTFDFSWQMSTLYSAQFPDYDGTTPVFKGVGPLSGEYTGNYVGRNPVSGIFGVTKNSKNVDLAVKFLDYIMSEECQDLYVWGLKDVTYTEQADGSREYLPKCTEDTVWYQQLGINAPCMPSQQSVPATDVLLAKWHGEVDKELEQYIKAPFPEVYATDEEAGILNQYLVDIQTYVEQMNVAFISGTNDLSTFDSYLETLKSMNVEELIKIKQAQYDRYMAAYK
ncbi:MAG: extracellular solute-binding protein [Oscillospiraceae bacterium]|nr:extracellular solute-binding protein [Oscillospiraceae bacterium]